MVKIGIAKINNATFKLKIKVSIFIKQKTSVEINFEIFQNQFNFTLIWKY